MSQPELPSGLTRKATKGNARGAFQSTVIGTAIFIAEMQRKIPTRTKVALIVLFAVVGGGVWLGVRRARERAEAEARLATALTAPAAEALPVLRALIAEAPLDDASLISAIERVGRLRDAEAVPALVGCLSRSDDLKIAAADALARIGSPGATAAQDRLLELVRDARVANVLPYAWALTTIGHADSAEIVLEALPTGQVQALPSYDPGILARTLGTARLLPRLSHTDARIRQFAASALGPMCDASAVGPLASVAADADRDVRLAALVSLGRCGTDAALAALDANLDRDRTLWPSLQAAFLSDVGAPAMAVLLAHVEDAQTRGAMLTALAAITDPRAGDALVRELERRPDADAQLRLQIAAALAEISDARLVSVLEPVLASTSGSWAAAAIEILGRTGAVEHVEPTLLSIAASRAPERTAALAALASLRACSEAARGLYRRWAREQGAAALGLARCGEPSALEAARTRIAGPLPRRGQTRADEGTAWRTALEAVALARATDVSERLLELVSDAGADPTLRSEAGAVLGLVGDDRTLDVAADRMVDARTPSGVRQALSRALRRRTPSAALGRLMGYVRGGEDDERSRLAAIVVGEQAGPELRAELLALLGDERGKRHAALALALGGNDASAEALGAAIAQDGSLLTHLRTQLTEMSWEIVPERVIARVLHGARLRDQAFGLVLDRFGAALRQAEEEPASPSTRSLRRMLEARIGDADAEVRRGAAEALALIGDRGFLLALRQRGGPGAEEAGAVLSPSERR